MTRQRILRFAVPALVAGVIAGAFAVRPERTRIVGAIPDRLADTTFWRMFSDMSEPNGYFRSDNFVSNETEFQHVIPGLKRRIKPGGVYLGVGPDQNFTYIVAFRPRIAFVVDIRRQNAMQHLMYKAMIELSADRAEFLSRLFGRPRPAGLDANASPGQLLSAYAQVAVDDSLVDQSMNDIERHLSTTHGFPLTDSDIASIEYVYGAFVAMGPELTYANYSIGMAGGRGGIGRGGSRRYATYASLMQETDGRGSQRSYLANEEYFRTLKEFESRNLLVPLVGDFAGDKALRAVGRWLKERGATVSFYYTSNVEQYLFQQDDAWARFYKNVAVLPIDAASTFIRSASSRGMRSPNSGPLMTQLVMPIGDLLDAVRTKRVRTYRDMLAMSGR